MPSFNPIGSITGKTSATLFEIRLVDDFVVLRGTESEAADQILKGSVVLCLPASIKVEDVHLKFTGELAVGWDDQRVTPSGITHNRFHRTSEILKSDFPPFVGGPSGSNSRGSTLAAGNYEWDFEFPIPGTMFESVEGLDDSHIRYKLKATVARGKFLHDLHAYKAVRIIRTLDPSALELAHAMTVENIWPNKIEYQLIIPQKAIIFGTHIDVEMRFTSLLKGLKIGAIKCVLIENQEFSMAAFHNQNPRAYKHTRNIGSWEFHMSEDENYNEELESGTDGWTLKEKLLLPKTLSKCMQDVEIMGIKIRHKVTFNIALLNPDGHTSELRASLPVTIFISPNMALNDDGDLVDQNPISDQTAADISMHAPPLYGQHVLDQLYASVESGLMTPHPQSGMNTPFTQSRRGSSDNLASLNSAASDLSGPVHPDALSSRLHDLNLNSNSRNSSFIRRQIASGASGANTPRIPHGAQPNDYFGNHSADHSTPLSRRTSEEELPAGRLSAFASGQQTPEHLDYSEMGDLTKVPSYNTAVRAPVRGMSYSDAQTLPGYESVSTPIGSPPTETTSTSTSPFRRHLPTLNTFATHAPNAITSPGDEDGRRRSQLLRNRNTMH